MDFIGLYKYFGFAGTSRGLLVLLLVLLIGR